MRNKDRHVFISHTVCIEHMIKTECTGVSFSENDVGVTSQELQETLISTPRAGFISYMPDLQ
jgi:hypothetical protein